MAHVSNETALINLKNSSNKLSAVIIDIRIFLTDPDLKNVFTEGFLNKLLHPDDERNIHFVKTTLDKIKEFKEVSYKVKLNFILLIIKYYIFIYYLI